MLVGVILRRVLLSYYRNAFFISLATILSIISLRTSPAALPIVLNLAILLTYSRIFVPRKDAWRNATLLWLGLTIGGALPKLGASWSALSSPGIAIVTLLGITGINSLLSILVVALDAKICMQFSSPWSQIALFPSLWVTLWSGVAYVSPLGRLSAWSPTEGTEAYSWLMPFLGPAAIDWIVAAWAAILAQAFAAWYMNDTSIIPEPPLIGNLVNDIRGAKPSQVQSSVRLAFLLIGLAVPSYFIPVYPTPILSQHSTPLSVACVLPPPIRYKHHTLTLNDYIKESETLTSSAKILLWPESAVVFTSNLEKEAAFEEIRKRVTGSYVGVSFEEAYADPTDKSKSARRNGFALISKDSEEPHMVYYKRKLVPIAESFSLTHSEAPPEMFTIELPPPHGMNKTDWSSSPNHTRPISVTASICLDFTDPYPFSNLESRPTLILAPARTWDFDIGIVMWEQAKQRADELGAMVLWCDGGYDGVSGVAGQGMNDIQQIGRGSWVRSIGVDYPHNESRTWYAAIGCYNLLLLWLITLGGSIGTHTVHFLPGGITLVRVRQGLGSVSSLFKRRRGETQSLLGTGRGPLVDLH